MNLEVPICDAEEGLCTASHPRSMKFLGTPAESGLCKNLGSVKLLLQSVIQPLGHRQDLKRGCELSSVTP